MVAPAAPRRTNTSRTAGSVRSRPVSQPTSSTTRTSAEMRHPSSAGAPGVRALARTRSITSPAGRTCAPAPASCRATVDLPPPAGPVTATRAPARAGRSAAMAAASRGEIRCVIATAHPGRGVRAASTGTAWTSGPPWAPDPDAPKGTREGSGSWRFRPKPGTSQGQGALDRLTDRPDGFSPHAPVMHRPLASTQRRHLPVARHLLRPG